MTQEYAQVILAMTLIHQTHDVLYEFIKPFISSHGFVSLVVCLCA